MKTNRDILAQGIKYMAWALPLMFIGPTVIYNAFINTHTNWHYLILALGIGCSIGGVYLAFKGLQTILKSLFGY